MKNILILVSLSCLLGACGSSASESPEVIRPVRYQQVYPVGALSTKVFSGVAEANQATELSMKVAGNLSVVAVKTGERVKQGQLLVMLDDADYRIQYDQALVQKKSAEQQQKGAAAAWATAKSTHSRMERLYVVNSVSQSDYERAKMQFETTQAQLATADAQVNAADHAIQAAKNQLDYARLYAPFDGIVNEVRVEERENVRAGQPILVMSALGHPQVHIGVAENFITQVEEGMEVNVQFSVIPGKEFVGTVEEVSFVSDRSSTFPAKIALIQPSEEIRPGMAAEVRFSLSSEADRNNETIVVPSVSVGEDQQGRFVYVVQPDTGNIGVVQRLPVEVGSLTNEGIEVLRGLEGGEFVVTAGISVLTPGTKVLLNQ